LERCEREKKEREREFPKHVFAEVEAEGALFLYLIEKKELS
jgi:hypothetical protein